VRIAGEKAAKTDAPPLFKRPFEKGTAYASLVKAVCKPKQTVSNSSLYNAAAPEAFGAAA
jgi:hypothetical protein